MYEADEEEGSPMIPRLEMVILSELDRKIGVLVQLASEKLGR